MAMNRPKRAEARVVYDSTCTTGPVGGRSQRRTRRNDQDTNGCVRVNGGSPVRVPINSTDAAVANGTFAFQMQTPSETANLTVIAESPTGDTKKGRKSNVKKDENSTPTGRDVLLLYGEAPLNH